MPKQRWNIKETMAFFHLRSRGTLWRWQRTRGFPIGVSYTHGGPVLFDVAAVMKWAEDNERPQYVEGRSTGPRPEFNCDRAREAKEQADA